MVKITRHSGIYTLESEQFLKIPLKEAWEFFSSPANLARITPEYMGFEITSPYEERAFPGQIITYKIGVFPGVKSNWVTEITQVVENQMFVDEQRFGPYAMWHHEHWFTETDDGVMMFDRVSYKLPFGRLGRWFHFLIEKRLIAIFTFRYKILASLFS